MAIYKLPPGKPRITGVRRGSVFQKACNQFVIRHRMVPVQKQTPQQTAVKNKFHSNQHLLHSFTGADYANISQYSADYLRTDSLGNTYELNSVNMATSVNQQQLTLGNTQVFSQGAPSSIGDCHCANIQAQRSSFFWQFAMSPVNLPAGWQAKFYAAPPQINAVFPTNKKAFKQIFVLDGPVNTSTYLIDFNTNVLGINWDYTGWFQYIRCDVIDPSSIQVYQSNFVELHWT